MDILSDVFGVLGLVILLYTLINRFQCASMWDEHAAKEGQIEMPTFENIYKLAILTVVAHCYIQTFIMC